MPVDRRSGYGATCRLTSHLHRRIYCCRWIFTRQGMCFRPLLVVSCTPPGSNISPLVISLPRSALYFGITATFMIFESYVLLSSLMRYDDLGRGK